MIILEIVSYCILLEDLHMYFCRRSYSRYLGRVWTLSVGVFEDE